MLLIVRSARARMSGWNVRISLRICATRLGTTVEGLAESYVVSLAGDSRTFEEGTPPVVNVYIEASSWEKGAVGRRVPGGGRSFSLAQSRSRPYSAGFQHPSIV